MPANRWLSIWLLSGVVLILFQIVIGGVTRLTGSGLSITKWEIVVGTLPPVNEEQWEKEFDLYRETPQYKKINKGMSLSEFKFIYFWEYFHRLWARMMGFVFIIPFALFYFKKKISNALLKKLLVVFFLAVLVAVFGWIMVASGLVDRPWVNAYKLSIHLGLAMSCLLYLFHTWLWYSKESIKPTVVNSFTKRMFNYFLVGLIVQLLLGGVVSGMRAALVYPTWPTIGTEWLPAILLQADQWSVNNFINYDSGNFMSALFHFLHRNTAYLLVIFHGFMLYWLTRTFKIYEIKIFFLITIVLVMQVTLGILTLINSVGTIPVFLGVAHQLTAFVLLLITMYVSNHFTSVDVQDNNTAHNYGAIKNV